MNNDFKAMFDELDSLLGNTDLSDVTENGAGFTELPDGYYLSEIEKAELTTSKSSKQPMVKFQMKIVDDGLDAVINSEGDVKLTTIKKTKNRKIYMYYVLKDEASIKRFVADMLKFEGETAGEPLLSKEYFTSSDLLTDALDCLIGMRIYVQISTTENDDETKSTWNNLISWKRAKALELPV